MPHICPGCFLRAISAHRSEAKYSSSNCLAATKEVCRPDNTMASASARRDTICPFWKKTVAQLLVDGLIHPVFGLLVAPVFKISVPFHKIHIAVHHVPNLLHAQIVKAGIGQHLWCPPAFRSREQVQRIAELRSGQLALVHVVPVAFVDDDAVGHLHDPRLMPCNSSPVPPTG